METNINPLRPKKRRSVEMKKIIKELENGVKEVFDSKKYKKYLEFSGKFHSYSFNNVMLILMQYPNTKRCVSYVT